MTYYFDIFCTVTLPKINYYVTSDYAPGTLCLTAYSTTCQYVLALAKPYVSHTLCYIEKQTIVQYIIPRDKLTWRHISE